MRTVVLGPRPAELDRLIARRRQLGQDLFDEVWGGEYHMAPAPHPGHGIVLGELIALLRAPARAVGLREIAPFNLGARDDYRVPDYGYVRSTPTETFVPSAAIVVEVVSPDDESYEKFAFYAEHSVDEIAIAEPAERLVRWFVRDGGRYDETDASPLLGVTVAELSAALDWP
jgi:Uma2 family endonuclease